MLIKIQLKTLITFQCKKACKITVTIYVNTAMILKIVMNACEVQLELITYRTENAVGFNNLQYKIDSFTNIIFLSNICSKKQLRNY